MGTYVVAEKIWVSRKGIYNEATRHKQWLFVYMYVYYSSSTYGIVDTSNNQGKHHQPHLRPPSAGETTQLPHRDPNLFFAIPLLV